MFKRFSFRAFFLCMLVVIVLMIGSFFAYTGVATQRWIVLTFNILRYPSHLIFGNGSIDSWGAFLGGMALNILLFSFVLERFTAIFRRKRKRQPDAPAAPPSSHDAAAPSAHNPY